MSAEARQNARADTMLDIRIRSASLGEFTEMVAQNVSSGGVFVQSDEPMKVGTLLRLEFKVEDGPPIISGVGRVVWVRPSEKATGAKPSGMGIKFVKMDDDSRKVVEDFVGKRIEGGSEYDAEQPAPDADATDADEAGGDGAQEQRPAAEAKGGDGAAAPAAPAPAEGEDDEAAEDQDDAGGAEDEAGDGEAEDDDEDDGDADADAEGESAEGSAAGAGAAPSTGRRRTKKERKEEARRRRSDKQREKRQEAAAQQPAAAKRPASEEVKKLALAPEDKLAGLGGAQAEPAWRTPALVLFLIAVIAVIWYFVTR